MQLYKSLGRAEDIQASPAIRKEGLILTSAGLFALLLFYLLLLYVGSEQILPLERAAPVGAALTVALLGILRLIEYRVRNRKGTLKQLSKGAWATLGLAVLLLIGWCVLACTVNAEDSPGDTGCYNGPMESSDWINLFSAVFLLAAMAVSLFIGLKSIRETRDIQKRQFRHGLLKEIVDWATEITTSELEVPISDVAKADRLSLAFEVSNRLRVSRHKYVYIEASTLECWEDLRGAIRDTKQKLDQYIEVVDKYQSGLARGVKCTAKSTHEAWESLNSSAHNVIQEAVKTRNRELT